MTAVSLAYDCLSDRLFELNYLINDLDEEDSDFYMKYSDEKEDLEDALELIKQWQ